VRPTIRRPTGERRRGGRTRTGRRPAPAAASEETVAARAEEAAGPEPDLAAARVREAGGPIDFASYACECGCLFTAAVSTSVNCPHCGAAQAW
jgi:hypothetical protein